ncbi:Bactoprenol glucosyl transferase [Thiorhodovibrio winogradskyi]|uniref:Bactoprenol glucosyl transferase n=1 Tax=Thiorhodovibrio winogradskyi TaxID=77007 RepID=A0ABZ0SAU3_9GAMM|nr:glycosyltransferase family 2 protein [Thiorhodovibrio winogradskyi]
MSRPPATRTMPSLSAIVPCYNEESVLNELRNRLITACQEAVGNDYELVLIDDGSSDRTREILRQFQTEDPRITVVLLSRNHGHQLALSAGLSVARGERLFVLDADLQDPPELLTEMMARMDEGYDVVYGTRRSRTGESAFKIRTAHLFYRLLNRMVDIEIPSDTGDFRLMSRRVADVLLAMPERYRFVRGMVSWAGFPQTPFFYDRDARFAGETKYPFRRMVLFAVDAVTSFSILPLRLATALGFFSAAFGFLFSFWVLGAWLLGATIAGWTSIALLMLLLGGTQLIVMGILGEYVGRTYIEAKRRPLFVVEQVLRTETPADD